MTPDDPRHETWAGYQAGCRADCCTAAARNYQKRRAYDELRGESRTIPAAGTQRRIQALIALGWTAEGISKRLGYSRCWVQQVIHGNPEASRPHETRKVWRKTAETIANLYDELAMTLPPETNHAERNAASRARNRARARGWAPPLAWEGIDIDDPDAEPWTDDRPTRRGRPEEIATKAEEFDFLIRQGESEHQVAARLGIKRMDSFIDQRRRLDRKREAS